MGTIFDYFHTFFLLVLIHTNLQRKVYLDKEKYIFFFVQNICQFMFQKHIYRFHTFQGGLGILKCEIFFSIEKIYKSKKRMEDKPSMLLRPEISMLACGDHLRSILICQKRNTQK